ncbi:MAG TPA: hypothetical protein VFS20_24565 [Longimicrobium sp.]|nr:hypothetical protein [Longimicrobium sp.]
MSETARDPEGRFELRLPRGWQSAVDEDGDGLEVWREEGAGTLHLISFEADEFPDPAEELYAFLQERGVELEDDEVEDLPLEGAELALTEFMSEDEDDGESLFWLVGVATAPETLVFATYFCPAGREREERDLVREALTTMKVRGGEEGAGGESQQGE